MYAWMWRRLPGGTGSRMIIVAIVAVAVLAALWFEAFPWAASHLPVDGGSVTG